MTDLDLLIDLHSRNDRQGPGDDGETLRALELTRLDRDSSLVVADIGCGVGASALLLASVLPNAQVTAIDAAPQFIERLQERAPRDGVADRLTAHVGQMASLPFGDGAFDLLWSEGAIYNMGFGAGVRAWRRFLRPGGVLAVSELSWTTARRPREVEAHWASEYPGISTVSANMKTLEEAGYAPLGSFLLPDHCWEANYYAPLRAGVDEFLERHGHSAAAQQLVESEEREMQFFREQSVWYGYVFYVARATAHADSIAM